MVLFLIVFLGIGGVFLHSLFAERYAQTANDAITAATLTGKTQLFQRTISGALAAYQTFKTAADSNDYETSDPDQKIKIRVYLAFTRMLDLFVRNGGGSVDTLAKLLAQYGVAGTGDAFDALRFNLPLNDDGKIILPSTAPPSAEALKTFFAGPFLTAVNASIADMDAAIDLCPTDGTEGVDREIISKTLLDPDDLSRPDVEMDAGDYYLFRALLKFMKAYALMCAGYNADIDIREVVALINMEAGQSMFKRILDLYPDFLKISDAAKMNEAREALIDAITDYETASGKIRGDASTQVGAEELFSLELADIQRAAFLYDQMVKVKDSLQNNKAVALGGSKEQWKFTMNDIPSPQDIYIYFYDNFSESGAYNVYSAGVCSPKFGCNGQMEYALINGSYVTMRFNFYYPYYGWVQFNGTFNADKTQITNGTYSGWSSSLGSYNGTFSANRIYFSANTQNINLLPLFGNGTAGSAKALRDMLPQMSDCGYFVPGTMGHGLGDDPTLGGMIPDSTQNQWIIDSDGLFLPAGLIELREVDNEAIVINGDAGDWGVATPVLTDLTGEKGSWMAVNGDLQKLYLARDSNYLYVRMEMAGDIASVGQSFMYGLRFRQSPGDGYDKPGDVKFFARQRDGVWEVQVQTIQPWGYYGPLTNLGPYGGASASAGKMVEIRVPLGYLTLTGRYLAADVDSWSYYHEWDYGWWSYDNNTTCLQIQPTATISGTLTVPDYDGVGPVRIGVFKYEGGFYTNPEQQVGGIMVYPDGLGALPASYTVANLPVGVPVFVYVFWDSDGNGVPTPGDYTGISRQFITTATNTANLSVHNERATYPVPKITLARVRSRIFQGGSISNQVYAYVTGPSPADVTITVTGPGGEYRLAPQTWIANKFGLTYMASAAWLPNGDYTFTAVDSLGRKAETTVHYVARYDLPTVTELSPNAQTYLGTTTPRLSWTPPAAGGPYAYQVLIHDYNDPYVLWYVSDITTSTSLTVPSGALKPNTAYKWYLRLFASTNEMSSCTETAINSFYTGTYVEIPNFSWIKLGTFPPAGSQVNYKHMVEAQLTGVAPWDITGWRLKKGSQPIYESGYAPYFYSRDYMVAEIYSSALLAEGDDYAFELDIACSTTPLIKTGLAYTPQDVETVNYLSLSPASNYYFKTLTPTFSWSSVTDTNTYYRLRIFDPLNKMTLYSSSWSNNTSATMPAGILKPGGNYYWTVMTSATDIPNDPENASYTIAYTHMDLHFRTSKLFTIVPIPPGDVTGDLQVTLGDAVMAFQVISGMKPEVTTDGDVNNDGRVGLPEAVYILQDISELR